MLIASECAGMGRRRRCCAATQGSPQGAQRQQMQSARHQGAPACGGCSGPRAPAPSSSVPPRAPPPPPAAPPPLRLPAPAPLPPLPPRPPPSSFAGTGPGTAWWGRAGQAVLISVSPLLNRCKRTEAATLRMPPAASSSCPAHLGPAPLDRLHARAGGAGHRGRHLPDPGALHVPAGAVVGQQYGAVKPRGGRHCHVKPKMPCCSRQPADCCKQAGPPALQPAHPPVGK